MSIPTASDVGSLDFIYKGLPFVGAAFGSTPPPTTFDATRMFLIF